MGTRGHVLLAVVVMAAVACPAGAEAANPWLQHRFLSLAHQGGEYERPSNTLYSFKRAALRGSDMLELDIHSTADDELAVIHDSSVDRTTNGTGFVRDMTLAQVQALDAAHNFIPGRNAVRDEPATAYPFRGVRTGERPPPRGYTADDFKVPTLGEIFRTFPNHPINIEIKGRNDADIASFLHNAEVLAKFLNAAGRSDVIVVSFKQEAVDRFHELAPAIPVAPGTAGVTKFVSTGTSPGEGVVALQVPIQFSGIPVVTPDFVRRAHEQGYAVHVFLDTDEENDAVYEMLVNECVDGIMSGFPSRLEKFLRARRIARPGRAGTDPCNPGARPGPCARPASLGRVGRGGRVRLELRRTDGALGRCAGMVTLRTRGAVRSGAGGGAAVATLARKRFDMASGRATGIVKLRLSRQGRRILARHGSLRVVGSAQATGARPPATRTLTLRGARR
jgi:glycerophosphoryl diester phosphodiesterase